MKKNTDGFDLLYNRYIKGKPRIEALYREEKQRVELAACLRELRESEGISQIELAKRVGTTSSVISRLENPDYEGHSLKSLQRIVRALGMGMELRLIKGSGKNRKTKAVLLASVPHQRKRKAV